MTNSSSEEEITRSPPVRKRPLHSQDAISPLWKSYWTMSEGAPDSDWIDPDAPAPDPASPDTGPRQPSRPRIVSHGVVTGADEWQPDDGRASPVGTNRPRSVSERHYTQRQRQAGPTRQRKRRDPGSRGDRSIFAQAMDLVGLAGESDSDSSAPRQKGVADFDRFSNQGSTTNSSSDSAGGYLDGLQTWVKKVLTSDMTGSFPLGRYAVDEHGNAIPLSRDPTDEGRGSAAAAVAAGTAAGQAGRVHSPPTVRAGAAGSHGASSTPLVQPSTLRTSARTSTSYGTTRSGGHPPAQPSQPSNSKRYTVAATDTLAGIALKHGMTPAELTKSNRLFSSQLYPGQVLYVRDDTSQPLVRTAEDSNHHHAHASTGAGDVGTLNLPPPPSATTSDIRGPERAAQDTRSQPPAEAHGAASAAAAMALPKATGSSGASSAAGASSGGDVAVPTQLNEGGEGKNSSGLLSRLKGKWLWDEFKAEVQYLGPNGVEDGSLRVTPELFLFLPTSTRPGSSASIVSLPMKNIPAVNLVRTLNKATSGSFLKRITGRSESEMKCLQVTFQALKEEDGDAVSVAGDIHHFVGAAKPLKVIQDNMQTWIERLTAGQAAPSDPRKTGSPFVDVGKTYPGLVGSTSTAVYELGAFEPKLDHESHFLTRADILQLHGELPRRCEQRDWELLYSTRKHGISLQTLYRLCPRRYSLLCVRSTDGQVFGALASEAWRVHHTYFGSGETFVWRLREQGDNAERKLEVFKWSRKNNYFMLGKEDSIAFGGGGHFALYIDADLASGSSGPCTTFDSEQLTTEQDFGVLDVEVWGFKGV
eukprot:TRINITY_DN33166_c0_g1_i1.p1 TRINITY_DN33166_c0_g1~~TRINITY_DN33166_c0_g1_i1.p1  ORF type:complete len:814 (-),score=124.71 TRINITY_DN33166_c0_g1_i1:292-2733(-)